MMIDRETITEVRQNEVLTDHGRSLPYDICIWLLTFSPSVMLLTRLRQPVHRRWDRASRSGGAVLAFSVIPTTNSRSSS